MAQIFSHRARDAIRGYRSEYSNNDAFAISVLERLERDQNGEVSAALERFGVAYDPPLIHYLLQAVSVAVVRQNMASNVGGLIAECERKARDARRVAEDSLGVAPLQLWKDLQNYADGRESMAAMYARRLAEFRINRSNRGKAAEQRIAIQTFRGYLKEQFNIDCDTTWQRQPVVWLVEAALGCTISESRIAEAFRARRVGSSS